MTPPLAPPTVLFKGRTWSSAEMSALAARWRAWIVGALVPPPPLLATPLANRPDSIALLLALSAASSVVMVLSEDPRTWRTSPSIPAHTPLVLTPEQRALAAPAETCGLRPVVVPDGGPGTTAEGPLSLFSLPALIFASSGTTGLPKPAYKATPGMFRSAAATAELQGVPRGAGIIGALPLSTNYGFLSGLALATRVGGRLALLERFDHRVVLAHFASCEFHFFSATPLMADILSRCPLEGPAPPAPAAVISSSGHLPPAVFRSFKSRFGEGPRGTYGSTEGNLVCAVRPGDPEQPDCVGRPAPGVEVRIGDDPRRESSTGTAGRVWYSSPWYMEGYGFPGALEPREEIDGWYPTSDLGVLDAAGALTLLGRVDECFKTQAGYLVNPAEVAMALRGHPMVVDVAVVPLHASTGAGIGALVVADGALEPASLRQHAARVLPTSHQPQVIRETSALPRMTSGKIDRAACIELLEAPAPRSAS
jgi:acyl-CoA synthetase (AMP-forming)/AMP-acid ligase II